MKKFVICCCLLLFTAMPVFAVTDSELYSYITASGQSYTISINSVNYRLKFSGTDAENNGGVCTLDWAVKEVNAGLPYMKPYRLIFSFFVYNSFIEIYANSTEPMYFIIDHTGQLTYTTDLRFFAEILLEAGQ